MAAKRGGGGGGGAMQAAYLMAAFSAVPLPLKASPPTLRQRGQAARDRKIIRVGHNPRRRAPPDAPTRATN